jgi:glycosyltransferase involved in cell wall biosynthesis
MIVSDFRMESLIGLLFDIHQGWSMKLAHLTASSFFGGPERQMLGLSRHLSSGFESRFYLFPEHGRSIHFATKLRDHEISVCELTSDFPKLSRTLSELTTRLRDDQIQILFTHGYKSNLLGRIAAQRLKIPAIAVSRGWTGENWKVRFYEQLDRLHLRLMDRIISVSHGQAEKVFRTGVSRKKVEVIHNASRLDELSRPRETARQDIEKLIHQSLENRLIFAGAGRLSPEKGFDRFITLAEETLRIHPNCQFVIFGEGPLQDKLQAQIDQTGFKDSIRLLGFRNDLDQLMPGLDGFILTSHTEGLPNVLLEAAAAKVPSLATKVGGVPELIRAGETGYLLPPNAAESWSMILSRLITSDELRRSMGENARRWVENEFSFTGQASRYEQLIESVVRSESRFPKEILV